MRGSRGKTAMAIGLVLGLAAAMRAHAIDDVTVPSWLRTRIAQIEKSYQGSSPVNEVWSFRVAGATVYLLRGTGPSELLDAKGNLICRPDGAVGTQACVPPYRPPASMTKVWSDSRLGSTVKPKPDNTK